MEKRTTAICTWFVSDKADEATLFPQIGLRSDDPRSQAVYWQCICCFFASSKVMNPQERHVFFTNIDLPSVGGISVAAVFRALSVEVVTLPISYRIKRDDIKSWGNQFYILDVIKWLARDEGSDRYLVLDSDCVWIRPIDDMAAAIDTHGVLTYDEGGYLEDQSINGCTRAQMATFLASITGVQRSSIAYCGGEIFAATRTELRRISGQIDAFWAPIAAGADVAITEEAHFLSAIYALNDYAIGSANGFIKRIWTTFSHRTTARSDGRLTVWHLPSEKKTGFARLFRRLPETITNVQQLHKVGFEPKTYARLMGVPHRTPLKFVQDLALKLYEKAFR